MNTRKLVALIGFCLGSATMIAQLLLTVSIRLDEGDTLFLAVVHYLSFLTYLANIGVVLVYAGEMFSWRPLKWFTRVQVQASALATIMLVALFYHFILKATLEPPVGIDVYLDPLKHYVLPALYVIWWALWPAGGKLRLADLPLLAIPGVVYPAFVFLRGALVNDYPYSVIDVRPAGYGPALTYAAAVVVGFTLLCLLIIIIDRLIARIKPAGVPAQ